MATTTDGTTWTHAIHPRNVRECVLPPDIAIAAVSAVDRAGNESERRAVRFEAKGK